MGPQMKCGDRFSECHQEAIRRHVKCSLGKAWRDLATKDLFTAVALSVRDQLVEGRLEAEE